jgi:hypothetical protein
MAASSPAAEPAQHGCDHADHPGYGQKPLPTSAVHALDPQPLRRGDAEQVVDQLGRVLEVVAAEPGDPLGVAVVLDPRLEHPVEGHQAHEGQGGE